MFGDVFDFPFAAENSLWYVGPNPRISSASFNELVPVRPYPGHTTWRTMIYEQGTKLTLACVKCLCLIRLRNCLGAGGPSCGAHRIEPPQQYIY